MLLTLNSDLFWLICALSLGPIVGSFLGLVSLRLPKGRDIIFERSACDSCGRKLTPIDLLPIFSYALSQGRCRTCRAPIPVRYPLLEMGCLALGLWASLSLGGSLGFISAVLGWWLLLIAVLDAEHFWLPDFLTWPLAIFGLIIAIAQFRFGAIDHLIGAMVGFIVLWGFAKLYKLWRGIDGLGGGDARLMAACGAWVGWQGLPSVLLWGAGLGLLSAFVLAAFGQLTLSAKLKLPFGTFLVIGLWLTWLYGPLGV
jgi:leader peptidase (prepilin peptidase) / N-methyltransferase